MKFPIAPLPHCLIAPLLATAVACSSGPGKPVDTRPYDEQVRAWREAKDEAFRSSAPDSQSPIPVAERNRFAGLVYFPVDPSYRVPASLTLQPSDDPLVLVLQTTGPEQRRRMQKVGTLAFSIHGEAYRLLAFADEGSLNRLFVPFGDLTNGPDTYRGGRYLEIERTATGIYDLDFNYAFNPYCVYNSSYDCPIPPRENRLPVAIRAGEKLPAGHLTSGGFAPPTPPTRSLAGTPGPAPFAWRARSHALAPPPGVAPPFSAARPRTDIRSPSRS